MSLSFKGLAVEVLEAREVPAGLTPDYPPGFDLPGAATPTQIATVVAYEIVAGIYVGVGAPPPVPK